MVGQEILVLFIMVRIRALQPQLTNCPLGQFFIWDTRIWQVRKLILKKLCHYQHFRTINKLLKTFEPIKRLDLQQ